MGGVPGGVCSALSLVCGRGLTSSSYFPGYRSLTRTRPEAPGGSSPSPRLACSGTSHAGRCVGNGSASSTAWSSAFERLSEMPGGGFRACAATASSAGPPTAAMVAAASRPACEDDATSREAARGGPGDDGCGPPVGASRAATSLPPRRTGGGTGGWRSTVVASAGFASDPWGAVMGTGSASPSPTGMVGTGFLLRAGRWDSMAGVPTPSSTPSTKPSCCACSAAVWARRSGSGSAAGNSPSGEELLAADGAGGDTTVGG